MVTDPALFWESPVPIKILPDDPEVADPERSSIDPDDGEDSVATVTGPLVSEIVVTPLPEDKTRPPPVPPASFTLFDMPFGK